LELSRTNLPKVRLIRSALSSVDECLHTKNATTGYDTADLSEMPLWTTCPELDHEHRTQSASNGP
jgi:hypothetical protein